MLTGVVLALLRLARLITHSSLSEQVHKLPKGAKPLLRSMLEKAKVTIQVAINQSEL